MAKSKTAVVPGQLSLFDTDRYSPVRSHYEIEDGYEQVDRWPPKVVSESNWPPVSESNLEVDPPHDSLTSIEDDSLTTPQPCGAIGKYHAGGTARGGGEYWRFSYRVGKRVRQIHIPGGCATSAIASSRAGEVREAIGSGSSAAAVLQLIRSWTRKKAR